MAKEKFICEQCGKEFADNGHENRFCSHLCDKRNKVELGWTVTVNVSGIKFTATNQGVFMR